MPDLNLPADKSPSPVVRRLVESAESYYIPDDAPPNFEATEVPALEDKKYLLGEDHGDGTWATRTKPWAHVAKMREAVKGFRAQGKEERESIAEAKVTPTDRGLPLEDMHAYALTNMMTAQQVLNGFDDLKAFPDGQAMIKGHLDEVLTVLRQYAEVGSKWIDKVGAPPSGTRAHHFMHAGLGMTDTDAWKTLTLVSTGKKAVDGITRRELADLRTLLSESASHLLELIDTRPMGGGVFGFFQSRQGPDPIANRAAVTSLSKPGTGPWNPGWKAALREGNVLREKGMIENVRAAAPPVLAQVGDAHVDSLQAALGAEATAIRKGTDFAATVTKR